MKWQLRLGDAKIMVVCGEGGKKMKMGEGISKAKGWGGGG